METVAPSSPRILWAWCPACQAEGVVPFQAGAEAATCRSCRSEVRAVLFPALWKGMEPPPPPVPPMEGEPACYFSPDRRADHVCDQCGVFMSAAHSGKWGARRICLPCLEKLRASGRDSRFESGRVLWDNICLGLAFAPIALFLPFYGLVSIVTAPAALVLGIWHWRKPRSLVPRGPWRMIVALVLAGGQVALMAVGFFFLVRELFSS